MNQKEFSKAIRSVLTRNKFREWLTEREGIAGYTLDSHNCPICTYLKDTLGIKEFLGVRCGPSHIVMGYNGTGWFKDARISYQVPKWVQNFIFGVDDLKSTTVKPEEALHILKNVYARDYS